MRRIKPRENLLRRIFLLALCCAGISAASAQEKLTVHASVPDGPVAAGETATVVFRFTNRPDEDISDIEFSVTLPSGVVLANNAGDPVAGLNPTGTPTGMAGESTAGFTGADLLAGDDLVFSIDVVAAQTGDYSIRPDAFTYSIGMDDFTENGGFTTLHVKTGDALFGSALETTVNGTEVTFDVYLANLDSNPLTELSAVLDLDAALESQNYYIVSPPAFVSDPGTFELDPGYDGSRNTELILDRANNARPGDDATLAASATAHIQFVVDVVDVADAGLGVGSFEAQVVTLARALGGLTADLSDAGTNPNPGGSAGGAGNDDPTAFSVGVTPSIGAALAVNRIQNLSSGDHTVTFELAIENLGEAELNNVSLPFDLNAVFGAGNYSISNDRNDRYKANSGELLNLNMSYNGSTSPELFNSNSTLQPGETAVILIEVKVSNVTDQGFGLGTYEAQFQVAADSISGPAVNDLSDGGNETDANGNNDAGDTGEDDPFRFSLLSNLGISTNVTTMNEEVTLDYYLEAFGPLDFSDLSLKENLDGMFGQDNYTMGSISIVDDPGTITLNPAFDGATDREMFAPGSSLAGGDTAQIRVQVTLLRYLNQGSGIGGYTSTAVVSGYQDGDIFVSDVTTGGTDPDPDGDDNPNEPAENGGSSFTATPRALVGGALDRIVANGNEVTLDLYLENFGAETAHEIVLPFDLDALFGSGNYNILTPPFFVDDPGTLSLNNAFDGSSDTALLGPGSTLASADTSQISLTVEVTNVEDVLDLGEGVYEAQFEVTSQDAMGTLVSDLSDWDTNPDASGDDDPTNDEDLTKFLIGGSALGIALRTEVSGTDVRYIVTVQNLGDVPIENLFMENPLNPVYGSGNYSILQQPALLEGPDTISLSPQYFGFNIFSRVVVAGSIAGGETVRFDFIVSVNTVSDQGNGFGVYTNQLTITGNNLDGMYMDDSDEGILADSNGNGMADDVDESDPNTIIIGEEPSIGVAEEISAMGSEVTFDFFLENLGNVTLSDVTFEKDLDEIFGAGNYSVTTAPFFVDDPGSLDLDLTYDGSGNQAMLVPAGSTLAAADTAQIRMVVDVTTPTDRGIGFGVYTSQSLISAQSPSGILMQDLSDAGSDPDPEMTNRPFDPGANDPAIFQVERAIVGVALQASVDGALVTFDYTVKNLGDVELTDLSIPHDLDAVFGEGNYRIERAPYFPGLFRGLELNPDFDGTTDTELIAGGTIVPGVTERFRVIVRLSDTADLGSGPGVYDTQVTVSADSMFGMVSDASDDGDETDMDGNGQPGGSGESDTTSFTVERSIVGAALAATVDGGYVTFDYTVTNIGGADLTNVSVPHDFDALFGAGNYTIDQAPFFPDMSNGLTLNNMFDGSTDTELVSGGTLAAGATSEFRVVVLLSALIDSGSGNGVYSTQVTAVADDPIAQSSDLSDDGDIADPNGNDMPDDTDEDDPTPFTVTRSPVGIALSASVSNPLVTFDYTIENLGDQVLTNVSVPHNFDDLFGAGNYTIENAPFFPGTSTGLMLNASFDGNTDTELIDGGTIPVGVAETFRVVVRLSDTIDSGSGLGVYSTQVTITANDDINTVSDISDDGTDPDPNGNSMPGDMGEDDPTPFTVDRTYLGVALQASVDGALVTFDYTVENLGVEELTNISLIHDLDTVFGFGNYAIEQTPFFPGASFNLMLNGSFNGAADTQLIAGGTIAAGVTETIRVVVRVNVPINQGMYMTQVLASASDSIGTVTDTSTNGTDPDPNGNGNPNDTGEDTATSATVLGSIGGLIWSDLNRDGIFDGGDETGIAGVTVFVDTDGNGILDGGEPSGVTDVDGLYLIENLPAGTYNLNVVQATLPPDMFPTNGDLPHVIGLGVSQFLRDADIGFAMPPLVSLPDLRNGEKRNPRSHRFDNVYGGGQRLNARTKRPNHRFFFSVQNDGYYADRILTQGKGISKRRFRVKIQNIGGGNVTGAFLSRGHGVRLESGEISNYAARIVSQRRDRNTAFRARIRSRSILFPGPQDLNRINIRFDASRTNTYNSIRPPNL